MKFQPELQALAPWVTAFGITRDGGAQPIAYIREAFTLPTECIHFHVRIAYGALGFGIPRVDQIVGPQHRMPLMFATDAVLVRAKSLAVRHANVNVTRAAIPVSYNKIALEEQGIVFAEGVPIVSIMTPDGERDLGYMTLRSGELVAAVA